MTRHEINKEILKLISEYNDRNPDQRFGQILFNLGIIDDNQSNFYIESQVTLNRAKAVENDKNDKR